MKMYKVLAIMCISITMVISISGCEGVSASRNYIQLKEPYYSKIIALLEDEDTNVKSIKIGEGSVIDGVVGGNNKVGEIYIKITLTFNASNDGEYKKILTKVCDKLGKFNRDNTLGIAVDYYELELLSKGMTTYYKLTMTQYVS